METTPYCSPELLARISHPVHLDGLKLNDWMAANRSRLMSILRQDGVILLRGLKLISSGQFAAIAASLFGDELVAYTNRSTPRTELKGNVYTSTEYPKEESIPQHNENAYSHSWPMKVAFLCLVAATQGGATPIADSRVVYQRIPSGIREKFERKGVRYVRHYGSVGLPWQEVFQADTREQVDAYCQQHGIVRTWLEGDLLRTEQVCPASARHPHTNAMVWFNQAHLFHVSSHEEGNREALLQTFGEARLPRHAYYGDGEALEPEVLAAIRAIYDEEKIAFPWGNGDLMLLDNMLYSHGRDPYDGPRKVLVAMAEARTWSA